MRRWKSTVVRLAIWLALATMVVSSCGSAPVPTSTAPALPAGQTATVGDVPDRTAETLDSPVVELVDRVADGSADPATGFVFDDVVELVPASLPDGWQRCVGGRSTYRQASPSWWTQTFGPAASDGRCVPQMVVTQIPPSDEPDLPLGYEEVKVGVGDGSLWADPSQGTDLVFTWAFQQNLIFESCCRQGDTNFLLSFAAEAYAGLRQPVPETCDDPRSDTSEESLISQLANERYRTYLTDGCPVRLNIAAIGAFGADDHCWPNLGNGRLGDLYFYSDPANVVGRGGLAARLDTDATIPSTATNTGFHQGDRELWLDPGDDTVVYVVYPDHTEAWPVSDISLECA